jgi:HNH endonuclease/AP2 domain
MDKRKYYVYVFVDTNGCYRYVGKGKGKRFTNFNGRTKKVRDFITSSSFKKSIKLHENLTNEEAVDIENQYLDTYHNVVSTEWNLLNAKSSSVVKDVFYSEMSELFEISDSSPSGLIRRKDFKLTNGGLKFRAGTPTGHLSSSTGYFNVVTGNRSFLAHRIVWCLYNKKNVPTDMVVNHIDSNRSNNHPLNLELTTARDNILKANKIKGSIRWREKQGVYEVRWSNSERQFGKYFNIKKFKSKEDALQAAEHFLVYIRSVYYVLDSDCQS